MAEAEVWLTSTSEERWPPGGEEYASRDEAIAHAAEEHDLQPGDTFYVARQVRGVWPCFSIQATNAAPRFFGLEKVTRHEVPEPASQPLLPGEAAL
jgi:hypothetical protein